MASFYETLTAAVADMDTNGYDSEARLIEWLRRIRAAADASMMPEHEMVAALRRTLGAEYARLVDKGGLLKTNPGVPRWTLERIRPELRAELDRRILASANLIKLNREQAIEKTLQRFSGWATSIPPGGSRVVERNPVKSHVRKSLAQLPFEERRVLIDQGHKLSSTLNQIVAENGGAIAGVWRSRWRQPGYNYREPHKEVDGRVFAVRGNWALEQGLMKVGAAGYTDGYEQPAELPFCRCSYQYVYMLRELPAEMITAKGREWLKAPIDAPLVAATA
jgi:hypothetical protein